jgi:hypothetical protein
MLKKLSAFLLIAIAFGMMSTSALPARASILTSATATVVCTGYTLTVNAAELTPGTTYTIQYSFTGNCKVALRIRFQTRSRLPLPATRPR